MQEPNVDPDEQIEADLELAWHREMDRLIEFWDDEPTHEKWRRGAKWN